MEFFRAVMPLFRGSLSPMTELGIERILDACFESRLNREGAAYCLGTAHWETGRKMLPVTENLNYSAEGLVKTFGKRRFTQARAAEYARKPQKIANYVYANRMGNGNEASGDGWRYRGRGLAQITGKENYAKASRLCGVDLVADPEKALDDRIAVKILVEGMRTGMFTGVSLADVAEPQDRIPDFRNDRAIINGKDRAGEIAEIAQTYYEALEHVDMLVDSRTIDGVRKTQTANKLAAVGTVTAVGATNAGPVLHGASKVVDTVFGEDADFGSAIYTSSMVTEYLPWIGGIVAAGLIGLFIYVHLQQDKIEAARRDDNERRAV